MTCIYNAFILCGLKKSQVIVLGSYDPNIEIGKMTGSFFTKESPNFRIWTPNKANTKPVQLYKAIFQSTIIEKH